MEAILKTPILLFLTAVKTNDKQKALDAYDELTKSIIGFQGRGLSSLITAYSLFSFAVAELESINSRTDMELDGIVSTMLKFINRELKLFEIIFEKTDFGSMSTDFKTDSPNEPSGLVWTGKLVDFVELTYATHASGSVNYGNIEIKELINKLGDFFGIRVKNPYHHFSDIKKRASKNRAVFLKKLEDRLTGLLEDSEGI